MSTGKLSGDFDIQVNYRLVQWPKGSGIRVGLGTTSGTVERKSWGKEGKTGAEDYGTNIGTAAVMDFWLDNAVQLTPAKGRSGALRLVRKGDQETGYYSAGGKWVEIGSGTVTRDDVRFALLAWGHDERFTNKKVAVAFDNFVVNAGTVVLTSGASKGGESRGAVYLKDVTFLRSVPQVLIPRITRPFELRVARNDSFAP